MKCWGVTLQWIGIPPPVLQFATNVPFCPNSSLKMKETKWTHNPIPSASVCHYCTFLFQFFIKNEGNQMDTVSGKPYELLGGGGVTLQWIGIPSPMLQFATNVPFCSNSSLKMKETKWTQCQESLMKCWGVQTSSTHLLF